jgi:hypothetical protein
MIDMKDDIRESNQATRDIVDAVKVPKRFKLHPQTFLEATHHPYAPFCGDTLRWESWVWHDASMCAFLLLSFAGQRCRAALLPLLHHVGYMVHVVGKQVGEPKITSTRHPTPKSRLWYQLFTH